MLLNHWLRKLALCVLSTVSRVTCTLSPITVRGTKLYDNVGSQFYVKGVSYRRGTNITDVLLDSDQCQTDAGLMKTLGVNTVRVYTVDATQNHDTCMQAFESQGIYVWIDLPTLLHSISKEGEPVWDLNLYSNWTATIDTFSAYDNVLFFTISDTLVSLNTSTEDFAPYIKAATRDIKAYQAARGYRHIPISYNSQQFSDIHELVVLANYLTCGSINATIDVFGMDLYSWCGNSSYYDSGYNLLYEDFQDSSIPVLFSETGCNVIEPRDFSDVATMLGSVFQAVFSGAIVYEWSEDGNEYGLVNYTNSAYTGFPYTLDGYNSLKTVLSQATPTGTAMSAYTPSNSAPSCPTTDASWIIQGTVDLPTIANLAISTVSRLTTLSTGSSTSSGNGVSAITGSNIGASTTAAGADGASNSGSTHSSLSTGTISGIAVGGVVVGLALAIGAVFLWRRRKSARNAQTAQAKSESGSPDEQYPLQPHDNGGTQELRTELPGKSAGQVVSRQELAAGRYSTDKPVGPLHEMEDAKVLELDAARPLREIDGKPVMSELP